jgi:uncharacterized protein
VRLVLDTDAEILTVRRYAPGEVDVAGTLLRAPFIVSPSRLVSDWQASSLAALNSAALDAVFELHPAVVLIGSDAVDEQTSRSLRRMIAARGVAFECMGLGAACRTYNVLAQERREVVAGLFP